MSGADGSKKSWNKKWFTSSIASLAEIASAGNLRRSTIYELPRFIARCLKTCIPNAVVYSIKKRDSRILVFVCQSHPVSITSVLSSCRFMQNFCELETLSGWPRAYMHHRLLANIEQWAPKIWCPATESIAIITTVKTIPFTIGTYQAVAVFAFSHM